MRAPIRLWSDEIESRYSRRFWSTNRTAPVTSKPTHLKTDDSLVYYWLGREFAKHDSVNHSKDEYVRGKAHCNTAESYFALLKRGITGSFHSVSEQHLQRYADEFAFRWNYRNTDDAERAGAIIKASKGKRLTYRRTDEA